MARWLLVMMLMSSVASAKDEPSGAGGSTAKTVEKVEEVYLCGNDVGVRLATTGWVVALESEVGFKRVDRIMSMALALLSTGKSTTVAVTGVPSQTWCGVSAKSITALRAFN